jgi:hypothetical protein
VTRITGGNFRMFERLLTQIDRAVEINKLSQVNKPVVQAARDLLDREEIKKGTAQFLSLEQRSSVEA